MRVGVPVECQNGHKATYYYVLRGLDWVSEGVPKEQNCSCPKLGLGQGWARAEGKVIIEEPENQELLLIGITRG